MASCFGEKLRVSVFGESHGNGIGALIEGLPAGASMKACQDYVRDVYYYCGKDIVKSVRHALRHYEDHITVSEDGKTVTVHNDKYGAVAMLMELRRETEKPHCQGSLTPQQPHPQPLSKGRGE